MKLTLEDTDRSVRLRNGAICYLRNYGSVANLMFCGSSKGKKLTWDARGRHRQYGEPEYDVVEFVYPLPRKITIKDIGRNVILCDGRIATITEVVRPYAVRGTCDGVPIEWHPVEHLWSSCSPTRDYGIASFIEDPPPPTGK